MNEIRLLLLFLIAVIPYLLGAAKNSDNVAFIDTVEVPSVQADSKYTIFASNRPLHQLFLDMP